MKKRFLSIMLTVCMVLSFMPLTPLTAEADAAETPAATDVTFTVLDGTENAKNAFDGDTDTKWCVQSFNSSNTYVIVEASEVVALTGYSFTTGDDTAGHSDRNPKSWTVHGSNDYYNETKYGTWTEVAEVTDGKMPASDKEPKPFTVSHCGGYKYYKFEFTSVVGSSTDEQFQLSEITLTGKSSDDNCVPIKPDFSEEAGWTALTVETLENYDKSYDFLQNGYIILPAAKYYLAEDIVFSDKYKVAIMDSNKDTPAVIDLNGHTLKLTSYDDIYVGYQFDNNKTESYLILQDVAQRDRSYAYTEDEYGGWTFVDEGTENAKTITLKGGFVLNSIHILGEYKYPENNNDRGPGTFVMRSGNVIRIYNTDKATTYMSGGTITGYSRVEDYSSSNLYDGGVYNTGSFTMSGDAKIQDCVAVNTCERNYARVFGGGVVNQKNATFTMKDNSCILNCHVDISGKNGDYGCYGGGVYNEGTFQMLDNSRISGCTVDKEKNGLGGAVYNAYYDNESVFKTDGGTIDGDVYNSNKLANKDNQYAILKNTMNDTATIIYGELTNKSTIEDCLVTFMVDGKQYANEVLLSGKKAIEPKAPTKTGESFDGWYSAESGGTRFEFDTAITADTMLYAQYEDNQPPTIDGLKNGESYRGDVTFTVTDDKSGIASVTANNEPLTKGNDGKYTLKSGSGKLTVTATDNAGNKSTVTVTVNSVSSGSHSSYVQKPIISFGNSADVKVETAADGSTVYTTAEGKLVLSRDGRTASITPTEGYEVENISVNGTDKGAITTLTGLRTGDKLVVSFKLTAEAQAKAEIAQIKALAEKMSLTARSTKTAKKNIKVTLKTDDESTAAIKEIKSLGYTLKYKYYRSTKKASKYAAKLSKTGKTYTNTSGKNGTKYYYKARVQIFDANGKLVAQTALKQCKYASRTWTKK